MRNAHDRITDKHATHTRSTSDARISLSSLTARRRDVLRPETSCEASSHNSFVLSTLRRSHLVVGPPRISVSALLLNARIVAGALYVPASQSHHIMVCP